MRILILSALCVLLGATIVTVPHAHAKDAADRYIDPTTQLMTEYLARFELHDMDNLVVFNEYLRLTDCRLFQSIHDNQFQQRELKQMFLDKLQNNNTAISSLYVRLPFHLNVLKYDFETQSIDILPESQLKNVNTIEVTNAQANTCSTGNTKGNISNIPVKHHVRLNFPISLYRIPLHKDLAQTIFPKLDLRTAGYETRIVYGYFYVHVEAIEPEIKQNLAGGAAYYRGQVNMIDLFIDQDRQKLLKHLDLQSVY